MKDKDILKQIYARAVQKRQQSFAATVEHTSNGMPPMRTPPAVQNSHAPSTVQNSHAPSTVQNSHAPSTVQNSHAPSTVQAKVPLEVFGEATRVQDSATQITAVGKAKVQAITVAMNKLAKQKKTGSPALVAGTQGYSPTSVERDKLMQELISVYREKRQMIDDLPPKHRELLEKMGHMILGSGTKNTTEH